MRYAQKFGRYNYDQLVDLAIRHQKLTGSLAKKHSEYFELKEPLPKSKFNSDQRFVVVTNGTDRDTLDAIRYWKEKGIKIDCVTYKIYEIENAPYIQFDTYNPEPEAQGEESPGIYIVNTNITYMEEAWRAMLGNGKEGKAAAYYDRKYAIQRIQKGSTVYLYHTDKGVLRPDFGTTGCDYI
jgi:hypothetical protein